MFNELVQAYICYKESGSCTAHKVVKALEHNIKIDLTIAFEKSKPLIFHHLELFENSKSFIGFLLELSGNDTIVKNWTVNKEPPDEWKKDWTVNKEPPDKWEKELSDEWEKKLSQCHHQLKECQKKLKQTEQEKSDYFKKLQVNEKEKMDSATVPNFSKEEGKEKLGTNFSNLKAQLDTLKTAFHKQFPQVSWHIKDDINRYVSHLEELSKVHKSCVDAISAKNNELLMKQSEIDRYQSNYNDLMQKFNELKQQYNELLNNIPEIQRDTYKHTFNGMINGIQNLMEFYESLLLSSKSQHSLVAVPVSRPQHSSVALPVSPLQHSSFALSVSQPHSPFALPVSRPEHSSLALPVLQPEHSSLAVPVLQSSQPSSLNYSVVVEEVDMISDIEQLANSQEHNNVIDYQGQLNEAKSATEILQGQLNEAISAIEILQGQLNEAKSAVDILKEEKVSLELDKTNFELQIKLKLSNYIKCTDKLKQVYDSVSSAHEHVENNCIGYVNKIEQVLQRLKKENAQMNILKEENAQFNKLFSYNDEKIKQILDSFKQHIGESKVTELNESFLDLENKLTMAFNGISMQNEGLVKLLVDTFLGDEAKDRSDYLSLLEKEVKNYNLVINQISETYSDLRNVHKPVEMLKALYILSQTNKIENLTQEKMKEQDDSDKIEEYNSLESKEFNIILSFLEKSLLKIAELYVMNIQQKDIVNYEQHCHRINELYEKLNHEGINTNLCDILKDFVQSVIKHDIPRKEEDTSFQYSSKSAFLHLPKSVREMIVRVIWDIRNYTLEVKRISQFKLRAGKTARWKKPMMTSRRRIKRIPDDADILESTSILNEASPGSRGADENDQIKQVRKRKYLTINN